MIRNRKPYLTPHVCGVPSRKEGRTRAAQGLSMAVHVAECGMDRSCCAKLRAYSVLQYSQMQGPRITADASSICIWAGSRGARVLDARP